jgi:hypothetical protein
LPSLTLDEFLSKLGSVFVPATVKLQIQAGLHAYVPTIPAGLADKPDGVPDETAILFWESQQTYWDGFTTLAVRTYTLTHGGVYTSTNPESRADFPSLFGGTLERNQPVHLFGDAADWMHGTVTHLVASRPDATGPSDFRAEIARVLEQIQREVQIDGAIACVGDDYLLYWELSALARGSVAPRQGIPLVQALVDWHHVFTPAPTFLPIGLWDGWPGLDVSSGSSFNMQFERRSPTTDT